MLAFVTVDGFIMPDLKSINHVSMILLALSAVYSDFAISNPMAAVAMPNQPRHV